MFLYKNVKKKNFKLFFYLFVKCVSLMLRLYKAVQGRFALGYFNLFPQRYNPLPLPPICGWCAPPPRKGCASPLCRAAFLRAVSHSAVPRPRDSSISVHSTPHTHMQLYTQTHTHISVQNLCVSERQRPSVFACLVTRPSRPRNCKEQQQPSVAPWVGTSTVPALQTHTLQTCRTGEN